jgi:hypothetical protein
MLKKESMPMEKEKIKNNQIKIEYISHCIFAIQKIYFHRILQE